MIRLKKLRRTAISILILSTVLSGCASDGGMKISSIFTGVRQNTVKAWWYVSFKINWPQDEDPAWETDLLIAHRIVAPVLEAHARDIDLWRFHRRAAPDEAGHRFSFIFHSTPGNARRIYADIDSSPVLDGLKAQGAILEVIKDDTNKITRPNIDDTSDTHWSPTLRKAWPYFIMGASRTWLDLISRYAEDGRKKPVSPEETRAFYRQINYEVEKAWQQEGGHAFLHHLNAIFGYGPVNLRGKMENF
jgi:hypothetical protein